MTEQAHLPILKRVGIFLIVVGVVDSLMFFYTWKNNIIYSSNFNIFAIVAGIFLLRGNLRATSLVQWFSAFVLACQLTVVATWPFLQPISLILAYLRFETMFSLSFAILYVFIVGSYIWVYRQLASSPVQAARAAAGRKKRSMKIPTYLGIFGVSFVILLTTILLRNNPLVTTAQRLAAEQVKGDYQLQAKSFDIKPVDQNNNLITATVTAWNDREMKNIIVKWQAPAERH